MVLESRLDVIWLKAPLHSEAVDTERLQVVKVAFLFCKHRHPNAHFFCDSDKIVTLRKF